MAYKKKRKVAENIWLLEGGDYLVDITKPESNDCRVRKKHKTLGEAKHYKTWVYEQWRNIPDWMPKQVKNKDKRRLKEFIKEWYNYYGKKLSSGEKQRNKLYEISDAISNPYIHEVTRAMFTEYRANRIGQVSLKSINNEQCICICVKLRSLCGKKKRVRGGTKNLKIKKHDESFPSFL